LENVKKLEFNTLSLVLEKSVDKFLESIELIKSKREKALKKY